VAQGFGPAVGHASPESLIFTRDRHVVVVAAFRAPGVFRDSLDAPTRRHLAAAGKLKKVALTAYTRQLLTTLNAMVRTNTRWQQIG
jgi:hypothetical protein